MPSRMDTLRERAKPRWNSPEHQQLRDELGGVEPGPEHPRYEDFIRLTDPRPMGRRPTEGQPRAKTPEYQQWWRSNTEGGQASYRKQKARQVEKYHEGPQGSGARTRADQRARQRGEVEQLGEVPNWDYAEPFNQRIREVMDFYGIDDREVARQLARMHPEGELPNRARLAAAKKPAKPKVRKPEEVWYDVHKHPEGVPGGMGRSPEHHLRNRGWNGHEINEGSGKKTIQYRNHQYPDFVISYGGGNSTKPDHNFRVLYMGTNSNIPKVHRAYSVAEAMNKVEELHQLQSGLVVQPMTYGAAAGDSPWEEIPNYKGDFPREMQDWNWDEFHNNIWLDNGYDHAKMTPQEAGRLRDINEAQIKAGTHDHIFHVNWALDKNGLVRTKRERRNEAEARTKKFWEREARRGYWDERGVFHEYYDHADKPCFNCGETHDRPLISEAAAPGAPATKPTIARQPNVTQQNTFVAPAPPEPPRDMTKDDEHPIGPPKPDFPTKPEREHDWPKKQKPQLQEIPAPPSIKRVTSALWMATQETWEEA